jgi:hypothetical protein
MEFELLKKVHIAKWFLNMEKQNIAIAIVTKTQINTDIFCLS